MTTILFHPLAEVLPLLEGTEFADLVVSIKTVGLLEPIILYEEKILDGRNRYRASLEAGVKPLTENYAGMDPIGFVCAKNLHRRHLTPSQKAMHVAHFATLKKGDVASQRTVGTSADRPAMSNQEAAKLAGVSTRTISDAKIIVANGTPEEIAKVKDGTISVKPVARAIRVRRGGSNAGPRAKVPEGFKSLTAAVKPGIVMEREGINTTVAAKKIGIALQTYQCARDIVLLSERTDLSEQDAKTVRAARTELDKTQRPKHIQKIVRPISQKVWGRNGNRFKTDKTRVSDFANSIIHVVYGCKGIVDREIPVLEKKQRANMISDLTAAIAALSKLRRRLNKEDG
jgi:hypothetical protein